MHHLKFHNILYANITNQFSVESTSFFCLIMTYVSRKQQKIFNNMINKMTEIPKFTWYAILSFPISIVNW